MNIFHVVYLVYIIYIATLVQSVAVIEFEAFSALVLYFAEQSLYKSSIVTCLLLFNFLIELGPEVPLCPLF